MKNLNMFYKLILQISYIMITIISLYYLINFTDIFITKTSTLAFLFSFILSFLITSFILNGYKFSESKYIKYLEIILIYIIISIVLYIIVYFYFKYNFPVINCASEDTNNDSVNSIKAIVNKDSTTVQVTVTNEIAKAITSSAPALGTGTFAGAFAGITAKTIPGSPATKLTAALVGGVTAGTVYQATVASNTVKDFLGKTVENALEKDQNTQYVRSDSPSQDSYIPSVLENGDNSPLDTHLITLLKSQVMFNVYIVILILLIIFIQIYLYLIKNNILINYLETKYSNNNNVLLMNIIKYLKKINNISSKYWLIFLSITVLLLIFLTIYNLYLSSFVLNHINYLIEQHLN